MLLHVESEVPADSKTNALLKAWKTLPATELAKLPTGTMVYSGMAYTPELMKDLGSLAYGVVDPESAEGKAIKKLVGEMADANPPSLLNASNMPARGIAVSKYDNPAKAVEAQLKLFKGLKEGSTFGGVLKSAPVVKENAKKHGGFDLASVSMKWDLEKTVEKQGAAMSDDQKKAMVEYMKSMLGEGSDVWFGTDGKTVVQVTAKDWDEAQNLLDRYQKGEDSRRLVAGVQGHGQAPARREQPVVAGRRAASHRDDGQVGGDDAAGVGPADPDPARLREAVGQAKTSYVGLAITLESAAAASTWLPATSINDVYKMYIEKLIKPNF